MIYLVVRSVYYLGVFVVYRKFIDSIAYKIVGGRIKSLKAVLITSWGHAAAPAGAEWAVSIRLSTHYLTIFVLRIYVICVASF